MKFEYYPNEIAAALAKLAGETDAEIISNAGGALYDLKAICENPYNFEYYRDLYKLLERVTATVEGPRAEIYIEVSGGLVQAVYADGPVSVEVVDLDTTDPTEADERAATIEAIRNNPELSAVW